MTQKKEKTPLVGGRVVLTSEQQDEFQASIRRNHELRKAREKEGRRRYTAEVSFETKERCQCGGPIDYQSKKHFVATGAVVFGGQQSGYWQEDLRACCHECGISYDPRHWRFAKAGNELKERRSPPGEDWIPPDFQEDRK